MKKFHLTQIRPFIQTLQDSKSNLEVDCLRMLLKILPTEEEVNRWKKTKKMIYLTIFSSFTQKFRLILCVIIHQKIGHYQKNLFMKLAQYHFVNFVFERGSALWNLMKYLMNLNGNLNTLLESLDLYKQIRPSKN